MLVTREREKLLNAIIYFVKNTKFCGTTKLFKLLNFLDFIHFRQTGRSVTGLRYYAWPMGPVPSDLYFEIKNGPKQDLSHAVAFLGQPDSAEPGHSKIHNILISDVPELSGQETRHQPTRIMPRTDFDDRKFTKRELRIMEQLAFIYRDATADQISEISHLKGTPWYHTKKTKGDGALIEYFLAADGSDDQQLDQDTLRSKVEELKETRRLLR